MASFVNYPNRGGRFSTALPIQGKLNADFNPVEHHLKLSPGDAAADDPNLVSSADAFAPAAGLSMSRIQLLLSASHEAAQQLADKNATSFRKTDSFRNNEYEYDRIFKIREQIQDLQTANRDVILKIASLQELPQTAVAAQLRMVQDPSATDGLRADIGPSTTSLFESIDHLVSVLMLADKW